MPLLTFGKLLPLLLTGILCLTSGNVPAGEASRQSPARAGSAASLRDTVQGVLRHHRALKSAKEEQRALRQDLRQAQAGFGPRVDVAGETGAGVMNDATARAAQMERDWLSVNTLSAQLVQPIWDGFATRSRVRMAQSALDAASARVLDTSTNLALNAIAAHIDLLRSMRLCELARANVRRHEEILGQAHERLALGADSQADVTQAQSRLSRAQSSLAEAEAGLRTAQATYTRLTGLRASRLEEAALPAGMPDSVAALLALAEKHNPALAACLHDIRRARGEKELQESGMYPSFQLEAGPAYSDRGGRNERWVSSFDVLATMRWNLFNSGADAARYAPPQRGNARPDRIFMTIWTACGWIWNPPGTAIRRPANNMRVIPMPSPSTGRPVRPTISSFCSAPAACWMCWIRKQNYIPRPVRPKPHAAIFL